MEEPTVQFLSTEAVHPEYLEVEHLLTLARQYRDLESQCLFNRRAADAIANSGAAQAIEALINGVFMPDAVKEPESIS